MNQQLAALPKLFLDTLYQCVTTGHLLTDPADCWLYSYDNSRHRALPGAVAFARTTREIQKIVQCCYNFGVPLVARGRGTGTPGGAVPVQGGVVLSLEKMDKIIEIDPANRLIRVQTGVLNQAVQDAVKPHGLFWPPDPGSAPYCTVGGNLGYNAAGPRAVKYGATRENTLGLTAIIGTGEIIHTGTDTTKGTVGYDLTRLLIGSEGTLAIISEATLKLIPLPSAKNTLRIIYRTITAAAQVVTKIMAQPCMPCTLEFLDGAAVQLIKQQGISVPDNAGALLLIDVDGSEVEIASAANRIAAAAEHTDLLELTIAENAVQAKELWTARKALSPALRSVAPKKINEDVVVPVAKIPALLEKLQVLSAHYAIPMINFGHAGNGNIHVNLMIDPENKIHMANVDACLNAIFTEVLALHGTLSGEHGIGIEKRAFVAKAIDAATLKLMRAIKQQFDPKNILNPGKIFPVE